MGLFGGGLGTILGGASGFVIGGPAGAAIGAGIGSGLDTSANAAQAAETQANAANQASQLQYDMFLQQQKTLSPFVQAGQNAISGFSPYIQGGQNAYGQLTNLAGLNGTNAQNQAINAIESSPTFLAQLQQGENAMRQNAAATGGLRGGNFQNALMQYRPTLLANNIANQMSTLGGLATSGLTASQNLLQQGQNAAANTGTASMNAANQMATQLGLAGAATAGGQLASGNFLNSGLQGLGLAKSLGLSFTAPSFSFGGLEPSYNTTPDYSLNGTGYFIS